ncbi:MAG: 2-nitropropane dioxygenase [Verrucomicrobiaceae bacterium]|nr:2-nitropropane dioxygenase [Verrucomicrobiaceae bacterium]
MNDWSNNSICKLLAIELPIIQAPMAGSAFSDLAIAVATAGGLGSLACAMLSADQIKQHVALIRAKTSAPINLNFFCHQSPPINTEREKVWQRALHNYYLEFNIDQDAPYAPSSRAPFDSAVCTVVEEIKPSVVSFHFGLPATELIERVKATGAKTLSSATTVDEARWLEQRGCDAIIAMGVEAGGHRGMFLSDDIATQVGTFALVPQIADAVRVPVIAAGGIADARGIAAAFALGASAVQIGTAYLFTPEAATAPLHRVALRTAKENQTALTNVFTGRPARGIVNRAMRELGPLSNVAPEFPLAGGALAALRAKAELLGSSDFSPLWAGQAVGLGREISAFELTQQLAGEALNYLKRAD